MIEPFETRLKGFVLTELAGLLQAIAKEKRELEEAVADFEREEIKSLYGAWS